MLNFARTLRVVSRIELIAATLLLALIVVVILSQVVLRYGWNSPIQWVEEISTASMIWLTFLAASLIYKEGRQMRLWSPEDHTSGRLSHLIGIVTNLLILATSVYVVWIALPIVSIENKSVTTSLPIDLPKGWVFSVPVIIGFSSISLTAVYFTLKGLFGFMQKPVTLPDLSPIPPLQPSTEEAL
ncbi:TRAP-type C4-dicarboxylate transport system, small permease component [Hoeflea sp. IMCC20628]|uniref:TRAP transporter small permease n=1 Tax=Hoeflea sp. IMCC20628 TaxID=1620421 RepID=UPI00063AABD0|nr:TRAP transporter small permease subunit [Hoeflea sp. IMCC20628]AKH99699.1 TRAP-type C4-dicarboxylate transport system, small permease component [Hoeflea sp. IMCC20628]